MTITLHEATEQVRELLDMLDVETGELPDGYERARAVVESKALAVAAYIDDSAMMADAIEARAKELLAHVKRQRDREAWLKRYLCEHMAALGVTELRDTRTGQLVRRYPGRDKSVEIFDMAQLPAEYLVPPKPQEPQPDKRTIKAMLDTGCNVPGARIVARDRLVMR